MSTATTPALRRKSRTTRSQAGAADLDGKLFVTVPEAATYLRSDPRSVRRAIAAGEIPSTRVGPRQLIPAAWLRRAAALDTDEAGQ